MRKYLIFFVFLMFFLTRQVGAIAQPTPPGNPGGGETDTPITGIEILIGIGSLFGAKKLFNSKKKEK